MRRGDGIDASSSRVRHRRAGPSAPSVTSRRTRSARSWRRRSSPRPRTHCQDLSDQIRRGEFAPLREWLRTEIHEVGSTCASPDDLLRAVTGDGIDPAPFLDYLTAKYGALYGL